MPKTRLIYRLDGQTINNPLNWRGTRISATFDSELQPTIETEVQTFVNQANKKVVERSNSGLNGGPGMFIGMPETIDIVKGATTYRAFDGFLDFTQDFKILNSVTSQAKAVAFNGPLLLEERAAGVTFGYLESIGFITDSDFITVEKVIEKENNFLEIAITAVVTYLMLKEIAESIQRINDRIATLSALIGTPPGGSLGAIIYAALILLVEIAYTAVMIIYVTNLARQIVESFISPVIKDKGITWRKMLEKGLEYLGFSLQTNLSELDFYTFYPSNPFADDPSILGIFKPRRNSSGLPQSSDFGYSLDEFIEVVKRTFKAKLITRDGTVFLYNELDEFWEDQSTYTLPDVLIESEERNTDEFKQSTIVSFVTDPMDDWTVINYKGTIYETVITPVNSPNPRLNRHKGIEQIAIPYSLGSRKNDLNTIEQALFDLLNLMDDVISVFGVNSNLSNLIGRRIGMLRVWRTSHSVAKTLYIQNGRLPINHRELLSARYIWENYYRESSFLRRGQKKIFTGIVTKFDVDDFLSLTDFGYFSLIDGTRVRAVQGDWVIDGNKIELTFEKEEVYDRNLKEEFYEPG